MTGPTRTPDADPNPSTNPSTSLLFLPAEPSPTRTTPNEPGPSASGPRPSDPPPPWSDPADALDFDAHGPAEPSDTPSTGKARSSKIAGLRATMRGAVKTAGGIANVAVPRFVTRDPAETYAEVWVPDTDDVDALAVPLANIAGRRAPAAVSENPDLVDLAAILAGLVGYVVKALGRRADLYAGEFVRGTVELVHDADPTPAAEPSAPTRPTPGSVSAARAWLGRRGAVDLDQLDGSADELAGVDPMGTE